MFAFLSITGLFMALFALIGLADKHLRIGFIERFIDGLPNADEDRR